MPRTRSHDLTSRVRLLTGSADDQDSPEGSPPHRPPQHLVVVPHAVVTAADDRILFYGDDLRDAAAVQPRMEVNLGSSVDHLCAADDRGGSVVAALDDGSLVDIVAPEEVPAHEEPVRVLADLGGRCRWLFRRSRALLAVVDDGSVAGPVLVEIEPGAGRIVRSARVPLARPTSVTLWEPAGSDLLVVLDERRGLHVVGFAADRDGDELEVVAVDAELRATAALYAGGRWITVARKGGEVRRAPRPGQTEGTTPAEVCRRLRELLKRCGCGDRPAPTPDCECAGGPAPGRPGSAGSPGSAGEPGRGRPGGGAVVDDEPCERRQRANLGWTVGALQSAGRFVVATSVRGERMAVLDERLDVVVERFLGPRGARVVAHPRDDRLLVLRRGRADVELFSPEEYHRHAAAVDVPRRPPPRSAGAVPAPAVFHGRRTPPAAPNPHLRVAVFPVIEPGQSFGDVDQTRMHALLEQEVYAQVRDYYREISFELVTVDFAVFGAGLGPEGPPLVLPRAVASYFWDAFTRGGIEAVMPADWGTPLRWDGSEALVLRTAPRVGVARDYTVPFAAIWSGRQYPAYPVSLTFAGGESFQLDVEDQTGAAHALLVTFPPLQLDHAQGDDEEAFLGALGQHVTAAVRDAEVAAGVGQVVQDVVFRRIRTSDNAAVFGRLQGEFAVEPAAAPVRKGRLTITVAAPSPAPLLALGIGGPGTVDGVLGSRSEVELYLRECLEAALHDADEGPGLDDPHLSTGVVVEEDAVAGIVTARIELTSFYGGAGAHATVVGSSGLEGSGWSAATPVPGSQAGANNQSTLRDGGPLTNDVFTAALDRLRATQPWDPDQVQADFAGFDVMMIGFVGACPLSVPAAERWSAADPVDFARLRMFKREAQATDIRNPDAGRPPVTLQTTVVLGQRFDRFDAGVMSHEIGHGLGLPDLYANEGFRDDVVYIDRWCQMAGSNDLFSHFCAWSKWAVGWIVETANPATSRVVDVPMPAPDAVTATEAWLVPVEYWDAAIRAEVEATIGAGVPVAQMMKVCLGSDGGVFDIVEFRAPGRRYSQHLPHSPAVIVTNVLDPATDRRWAVNGLYRRSVHLLNRGDELRAVGDSWDFAAGREFPVKGCRASVVDRQTIRGGSVPICRVRVEREPAEFIDLHFQDPHPSWRSPDIWVDWRGDNADPDEPRVYPEGTPTDQGETVRFPSSGTEAHFVVARPHNAGSVDAEEVRVRWFVCDPPGSGDDGRWVQRDTRTVPVVAGDTAEPVAFEWAVDPATSEHQCLRAEIIDWTIPDTVDPATGDTVALSSDDVRLQNNVAQKNVFDFEAAT